jgi:transcriptional regulator with XRE-family HTH domain
MPRLKPKGVITRTLVGNRLRRLRKKKGWGLAKLCSKMKPPMDPSNYRKVERGDWQPSNVVLLRVLKAMNMTLAKFWK